MAPRRLIWRMSVKDLPGVIALGLGVKLVTGAPALVAVVGLGVAGFVLIDAGGNHLVRSEAGAAATATPSACAATSGCTSLIPQKFATIEEAAAQASFQPALPAYLPAGFQAYSVEFTRFAEPPIRKEVHNDWITVRYRDAQGHKLIISQGFPAMFGFVAYPGQGDDLVSRASEDAKGTVSINGKQARWLRAEPWPPSPESENQAFIPDPELSKAGGLILAWEVGRFGPGWEISLDRSTVLTGSPFSYSITSDALSLEELIEIGDSVFIGSNSIP